MTDAITWNDFMKIGLYVGTIVACEVFEGARKPAYKLKIDFGTDIGTRKSSAQITQNYAVEELIGKQVLCALGFPPKQIGAYMSEFLTTGMPDMNGNITLLSPDHKVANGTRLV